MSSLGSPNPLLFGGAAKGYEIERSVRFDKDTDDQSFDWTPSSDGNRKTWTFSCWLKRSKLPSGSTVLSARSGSLLMYIRFLSDKFDFLRWNGASAAWQLQTNRLFRDTSSWYHLVVAFDTTQATASNRIKVYVNGGAAETSFAVANYPNQNTDWHVNQSGYEQSIGYHSFDGYITEVNFIDGQALDGSHFGETDSDTGQWIPKEYEGTYGSNGYFLNFADNSAATAAAIGKDSSGNSNNFTPANVSVTAGIGNDSFIDTPTNNFCIWNAAASTGTIDKGGTHRDGGGYTARGTTILKNNKYYFEVKIGASTGTADCIGVARISGPQYTRDNTKCAQYFGNGEYKIEGANQQSGWSSYDTDDVIGCAIDTTQSPAKIWFAKNNTWQNSGNPSTGANGIDLTAGEDYVFSHDHGSGANTSKGDAMFGGNGYHVYTPPTDFVSACVANLPKPTIKKGTDHFNTVLYTGTGNTNTNTVTGVGFTPNLVWCKDRSSAFYHGLWDTVRGVSGNNSRFLVPSETFAEGAGAVTGGNPYLMMNSLDADGFTLGATSPATASVNHLNDNFVSWNWLGNSSNVSNSDGDIDSIVNVNATAGFSIVTWTGDGTDGQTVGHGLGVKPEFIVIKKRENNSGGNTGYWNVQHTGLQVGPIATSSTFTLSGYPNGTLYLNDTQAQSSYSYDNQVNGNTDTFVAYCFAGVEGYSKLGSYTGNGDADGAFVYTGFKPAWVITKRTVGGTSNWNIFDNKRPGFNLTNDRLFSNLNYAETESSGTRIDLLSNGFKMRGDNVDANGSGSTYVYMAFAETSFKYANAF